MKLRTDLPLGWRLRAGAAALVIPPLVHLVPLHRLAPRLGGSRRTPGGGPSDARAAAWIDALLERMPGPWRHTCLKRSAVLYHLLRQTGEPVELWIGVRRGDAGALAAHAWLVREGAPYLERGDEEIPQFAVIARFPEGAAS